VTADPLAPFAAPTRAWFGQALGAATPVQARGLGERGGGPAHAHGRATGSGKTLAAFLWAIDRLVRDPRPGTRVVYVSPIKALAYDIERNLRVPLAGIGAPITVDVRTGDTPAKERERQRKDPGRS